MRATESEHITRTIAIERATEPFEFMVVVSDHTMSATRMAINFSDPEPQRFPFTIADRDHVQRCFNDSFNEQPIASDARKSLTATLVKPAFPKSRDA